MSVEDKATQRFLFPLPQEEAFAGIEKRKVYKGKAQKERIKYKEEISKLTQGERAQNELEERQNNFINTNMELALEAEINPLDANRALIEDIPVDQLYFTGLNRILQKDEISEKQGEKLLAKAKAMLTVGKSKEELDPIYTPSLITCTLIRAYDEKAKEPRGKERRTEIKRIKDATMARLS